MFAYLEPATAQTAQTVTFTVKDNAGSPAAIEGARIDVAGAILHTGSAGTAAFSLPAGIYPVKVTKDGFKTVNDTVTVESSAVSKTITMVAK